MSRAAAASRLFADAIAAGDAASLATLLDRLRRDDGKIARALCLTRRGRPRVDPKRVGLILALRKFHPGKTCAEAAQAIASEWLRYETTAWRADRLHPGGNPYTAGPQVPTPRAAFWELLAAGHGAPSARSIRRVLSDGQKLR